MIRKIFQWFKQKRLPLLAGLLVGTTYIPFPPWALLFCYAPLWIFLLQTKSLKQAFWGAWLTQFTLSLIGFHWIAYTAKEFGSMPWSVSIVALLLFASFIHLYIPLAGVLAVWLRNKFSLGTFPTLLCFAILHSLAERIWPSIFPWHLGYTLLWAKLPVYQLADLVGFAGLSSVILFSNAWVAWIWLQRRQSARFLTIHIGALATVLILLNTWGHNHKIPWNQFDGEIKATVIQANIGNIEKVFAETGRGYQATITEKFLRLSREAIAKYPDTDLLVWPETAYPDYLDASFLGLARQRQLIEGLQPLGIPLLTGAYSKEKNLDLKEDKATYNALFLIKPDGTSYSPPYRKTYLLAFGEYLPFSEAFPILLKWLPFVSNFGRGLGPALLTLDRPDGSHLDIGGQICYEGLYDDFSRGLAKKGALLLANVTNDSWFGYPFEPRQHLYMTLARAIETRRPLLRSTNTGISTGILANGEILQWSPIHEEWFGQFIIPYKKFPAQSFFVRYGHMDWVLLLIILFGTLTTGASNVRTRRP